jgi:hypothetical protein
LAHIILQRSYSLGMYCPALQARKPRLREVNKLAVW